MSESEKEKTVHAVLEIVGARNEQQEEINRQFDAALARRDLGTSFMILKRSLRSEIIGKFLCGYFLSRRRNRSFREYLVRRRAQVIAEQTGTDAETVADHLFNLMSPYM